MTRPLRHRIALALLAMGVVALGACTDPSAFASPSGAAEASPTPRPTQAVPSRPAPTPSASPSPSLAVATPAPHSTLEKLLPDFSADGQYMDKHTATLDDLSDSESTRFVDGLLADVDRPRTAFEEASASSSWLGFSATRVDGVSGDALEDAFVRALFGLHPGTETATDVGGRPVRWLTFQDDGPFPVRDVRVFREGDVVFTVTADEDHVAVALETLQSMFDPKLEEILPASIGGRQLERYSAPAAAFETGGDMCSLICPGEMSNLAKALGVDVADIDVAIAYSREAPAVLIIAFRVAGKSPAELVEGRIDAFASIDNPFLVRGDATVGGKQVTIAHYRPLDTSSNELLYAKGDTLFSIRPIPEDDTTFSSAVEEAVAALP